jgi:hypothetical protein
MEQTALICFSFECWRKFIVMIWMKYDTYVTYVTERKWIVIGTNKWSKFCWKYVQPSNFFSSLYYKLCVTPLPLSLSFFLAGVHWTVILTTCVLPVFLCPYCGNIFYAWFHLISHWHLQNFLSTILSLDLYPGLCPVSQYTTKYCTIFLIFFTYSHIS